MSEQQLKAARTMINLLANNGYSLAAVLMYIGMLYTKMGKNDFLAGDYNRAKSRDNIAEKAKELYLLILRDQDL